MIKGYLLSFFRSSQLCSKLFTTSGFCLMVIPFLPGHFEIIFASLLLSAVFVALGFVLQEEILSLLKAVCNYLPSQIASEVSFICMHVLYQLSE